MKQYITRIDKACENEKVLDKEQIIGTFCPGDYGVGPSLKDIGCLRTEITCTECWNKKY